MRKVPGSPQCPLTAALDFLRGAWTHEILWYLRDRPRRFADLKRDIGAVSAKVLTTRLKELEEHGVIARAVLPSSPPAVEYSLTPLGRRFDPILAAMADVGGSLKPRRQEPARVKASS